MLRVVSIINSLDLGGAETSLCAILNSTRLDVEHKVISLLPGGALKSEIEALGIEVIDAGLGRAKNSARKLGSLHRIVRSLEPDVLFCHMYNSNAVGALCSRLGLFRIPIIWNIHHSLGSIGTESRSVRISIAISRILSSWADRIVYVSNAGQQDHECLGFSVRQSLVIPNGYDLKKFAFSEQGRASVRGSLGLSEQDIVVGVAARVHPMKDHIGFFQALARAIEKESRLSAIVFGSGTENLEVPGHLQSRVHLLGARRDVVDIMSACDVGCLSSFGEAFPNVLCEFMACERPCITTDVGDAALIVDRYGLVVPPRNPAALADAIIEMTQYSKAQLESLGAQGRNSIYERFSIESVAARHSQLWTQVAATN